MLLQIGVIPLYIRVLRFRRFTLLLYIIIKLEKFKSFIIMIPIPCLYSPYVPLYTFPTQFYPEIPQQFYQQVVSQIHVNDAISYEQKRKGTNRTKTEAAQNSEIYGNQVRTEESFDRKSKIKQIRKTYNRQIVHAKTPQNLQEKKQKQQRQIEGRNANSNLLRIFFRRLEQILQLSPQIIDIIIRKNKLKISKAKFTEWLQINKAEYTNYIRLPCVKKLFVCNRVNRSGKFQTKIMRILLDDFLSKEAHLFYLTSKKIKCNKMAHNYHSIRNILKEIVEEQIDL